MLVLPRRCRRTSEKLKQFSFGKQGIHTFNHREIGSKKDFEKDVRKFYGSHIGLEVRQIKIYIKDGLPVIQVKLKYKGNEKMLNDLLLDTGSSNTIFDADAVSEIGIFIDPLKGKARRMYGVGGESELLF